ncbi:MAG: HAMP domain-containing sensor histidine kinase [Thermonemataceae bacterium]|nr:HAMP domain-containing sensor histidine kinase [Thermonemataceae bacterium]
MNLYQNKFEFKILVLVIALLIGVASLYYTNRLVNQLITREKEQINLFGQALRYTLDPENDQPITFIFKEIVAANNSIPVIVTDENENIALSKNIKGLENLDEGKRQMRLENELLKMKEEFPPIKMNFAKNRYNLLYYRSSDLIYQLKYYPYVQLVVISIFGLLTYIAFSYSRKAEQNRIWVGLAKETAHQLGTPISSLMAWMEYFKTEKKWNEEVLEEIEKDVKRLEMIAARFSNIGSKSALSPEDILGAVQEIIVYLRPRLSSKVSIEVLSFLAPQTKANINKYLFEWVIENLVKNAVDAMSGVGKITIEMRFLSKESAIIIDISDTGKGISVKNIKKVFNAGFTTKKRGWGLGLTLAKRIIEQYHQGKIFVKSSELDKGTKFRIMLPA